jgi:hypothetical protein
MGWKRQSSIRYEPKYTERTGSKRTSASASFPRESASDMKNLDVFADHCVLHGDSSCDGDLGAAEKVEISTELHQQV